MGKGLTMSKMFYEEYGKAMIDSEFSSYKQYMAFALVGQGSECIDCDDDISTDHDYAPGFLILLPQFMIKEIGNKIQNAYDSLPINEFLIKHIDIFNITLRDVYMTGARKNRIGVHSIEEFYFEHTGITHSPISYVDWTKAHPMFISEAVNGEVFDDYFSEFTKIRNEWLKFYPIDILKQKVAANCAMAAKTGQFNYKRSLKRNDLYQAYECAAEFVKKTIAIIYLLNNEYMPYYKWLFKKMDNFTVCKEAIPLLKEFTQYTEQESEKKIDLIEHISSIIIEELKNRNWSMEKTDYLLDHAKSIKNNIEDEKIKNMNLFVGED